ncbi:MAG: Flp pilus assembly complex ATPase component TadA [Clostridiales bacterium]|nr:Flp pilus assembly complex ATPase component TadA [Clostridiales bacterium]
MNKNNELDFSLLVEYVSEEINNILRTNIREISMKESELKILREKKSELRIALKNCGIGDVNAKSFVKDIIRDILENSNTLSQESIFELIPFDNIFKLTSLDKFEIILYCFIKEYKNMAFEHFMEECNIMDKIKDDSRVNKVTSWDVDEVYQNLFIRLSPKDKMNIITQRVYSLYKGLGVIDDIRDMKIEGISGGVSGGDGAYNSIWVFYKGNTIHLDFLDFKSERELERICMNIYRFGNPGQLSKAKGYIVNEMKDHSRVVVVRPPFSESFAFFVRKFDTIEKKNIQELLTDSGHDRIVDILRWLIQGCRVCGITGSQGSGKTTLLMSIIAFINPTFNLRIQELSFELNLRQVYPERNILSFKETDYVSGQEGLDIQKKTDGVVNILGEVATSPVAAWMVQMSQTGSLFTLFTHHAKTTDNLMKYMRNSLLSCNVFNSEVVALEQVAESINFDIHMEKDIHGHRYIERITEIIPDKVHGYVLNDIARFEQGSYHIVGNFSVHSANEMSRFFTEAQKEVFYEKYCLQT